VACLSVLVFHVVGLRWPGLDLLWAGVPMFFVISGYCIAASADRHVREGSGWQAFVRRRARRIYPPYLAFTALAILLTIAADRVPILRDALFEPRHGLTAVPRHDSLSLWQWLGSLTLTEGWRTHVIPNDGGRWFQPHAWSLGYEEQFYAITTVLIILLGKAWRRGAAAVTALVAFVASQVYLSGVFLDGRWIMFACGVAAFAHVQRRTSAWSMPMLMIAFAAWLASTGAVFASREQHLALELFIAAGFAAALMAFHRYDTQATLVPGFSALAWCGVRCYSIYLLHWPIARLVDGTLAPVLGTGPAQAVMATAAAVALTLGAAASFFQYVEKPCLSRARATPPAAVTVSDTGAALAGT